MVSEFADDWLLFTLVFTRITTSFVSRFFETQ